MNRLLKILLIFLVLLAALSTAAAEETLTLSTETLNVGEILDITVPVGENDETCTWVLTRDGNKYCAGKPVREFQASFRPRVPGKYTLQVTLTTAGKKKNTRVLESNFTVHPSEAEEPIPEIYSQKDGWWEDKSYRKSDLGQSGCAIFTLSHALHRMGFAEDATRPDQLGITYAKCLIEGGTRNNMLIRLAGEAWNFETEEELIEKATVIADELRNGSLFSFAIVLGHIALADGISDDGTMVHIADSAPSATFERIKNANLYLQNEDGSFQKAESLRDFPEAKYYFETDSYGGLDYWLKLNYVAKRGVRLIRPAWMTLNENNESKPVLLSDFGISLCRIINRGETLTVPTHDLHWEAEEGCEGQALVISSKKSVALKNSEDKKIGTVPSCAVVPVLKLDKKNAWIRYDGSIGTVSLSDAELLSLSEEEPIIGKIALNGKTNGAAKVRVRLNASTKAKVVSEWPTGTSVSVLAQDGEFYRVEARGLCVWVHMDYLVLSAEN